MLYPLSYWGVTSLVVTVSVVFFGPHYTRLTDPVKAKTPSQTRMLEYPSPAPSFAPFAPFAPFVLQTPSPCTTGMIR